MTIDLTYLQEITGGDPDVMEEMIDLFIRDIPIQLHNVRDFYNNGDLHSVGTEAHKLKPTLQYIGNTDMYELIKQIEHYGKKEVETEKIPDLLAQLFEQLDDTIAHLKEKRAELG